MLQMIRPKAMVRGEDEDESVAIKMSKGEGGGAAAPLRRATDAQWMSRNMARKRRRTSASAMMLPQSAGRTGDGDIVEKLQKNAKDEPAAAATTAADMAANAWDTAEIVARDDGSMGQAWRLCRM